MSGIKHILYCCFLDAPINCCCSQLPQCNLSTSTRLMYIGMLLATVGLSATTFIPFVQNQLSLHADLCDALGTCGLGSPQIVHTMITRLLIATTCFYLIHALLALKVETSSDFRARYHNGFWLAKYCLLLLCWLVALFFIPPRALAGSQLWPLIVMLAGSLAIVCHLLVIVDLSYAWNIRWVTSYESSEAPRYCFGLFVFTSVFFYLSVIVQVGLFVLLGSADACLVVKGCGLINCAISLVGSIVSVTQSVQAAQPRSGLLQSSLVALYLSYLTWSASISWPEKDCNLNGLTEEKGVIDFSVRWRTFVPLIIDVGILLHLSFLVESSCFAGRILLMSDKLASLNEDKVASYGGQTIIDNESYAVAYNYSLFHLILALTSSHFLLSFTDWLDIDTSSSNSITFQVHYASFWFKTLVSWICGIVYIIVLIAPIFKRSDYFSNNGGPIIV